MEKGKRLNIVIGVSSGIAGYKVVDLINILTKGRNIEVHVLMTDNAVKMFGAAMFERATGNKVFSDIISSGFDYRKILEERRVEHIRLADMADVFVVAPATANVIGKMAGGIADDFLTTTLLATTAPVLVCPSMNPHMLAHKSVRGNLRKLQDLGYIIVSPDRGPLACGYEGAGRFPRVEKIAEEIFGILKYRQKLAGKKIVVTAGGTAEYIDTVRVITNRGSGKMGAAIAGVCRIQGADVLLLRAGNSVLPGIPVPERLFETAKDLENLLRKYSSKYDVLFHTAAVSDFIPEKKVGYKLDSNKPLTLKMEPSPKILHMIKKWNPYILLVGFKAVYGMTDEEMVKEGKKKLAQSGSDFIAVNDVGRKGVGFGTDTNEIILVSKRGKVVKIQKAEKSEVAQRLVSEIFSDNGARRIPRQPLA
ncbi:bifunctional phosphopantothenoylcysteine decarboxylase/phosphopantothenate--cysteine ligase CoaBC [Patescibacteria group bacterium]|nr:bifunctional phosphopantothenoylcysteine decarboxylase/phosphopantothenate--cysteine ligase CoaBC [Patescibacteria group bacterium]MCL5797433.1 bifunctional phosphopantothenoylcysteine decarboxylase/phosphopantothenate--cysteine ligase CoaBC [Patescibacteria group bacterium]